MPLVWGIRKDFAKEIAHKLGLDGQVGLGDTERRGGKGHLNLEPNCVLCPGLHKWMACGVGHGHSQAICWQVSWEGRQSRSCKMPCAVTSGKFEVTW